MRDITVLASWMVLMVVIFCLSLYVQATTKSESRMTKAARWTATVSLLCVFPGTPMLWALVNYVRGLSLMTYVP